MTETVRMSGQLIPVVPQKHARLRRYLKPGDLQKIFGKEYSVESYRILGILIPELPNAIPKYKWEGFPSQEAMDRDEYTDEGDSSPTTAEIVDAFSKSLTVGGADRLGKIMDLVSAGATLTNAQQTQTQSLPPSPIDSGE